MSLKYSEATVADPLDGTELVALSQGLRDRVTTTQEIADLAPPGAPGLANNAFATRANMASYAPAGGLHVGDQFQLSENGRQGSFFVALASAWTAAIAADTEKGVFIASTFDNTKVYVRMEAIFNLRFNVKYFGAVLDNVTDDHVAVLAAVTLSNAMRRLPSYAGIDYGNGGGATVYVPGFAYMAAHSLTANHTFTLLGDTVGLPAGVISALRWDDGVHGLVINNAGFRPMGIALIGGFAGTQGEFHAIKATRVFSYSNLVIGNWSGDAMNLDCSGGANVNGVIGGDVWVYNCRKAYNNLAGNDNSAGSHTRWNIDSCRELGFDEETFLGVSHSFHEIAFCGTTQFNDGVNIGCSVTTNSGNRYFVIAGQQVWCETHAPSGTTADNQGWAYLGAGGAAPLFGILEWFNGMVCLLGGSVYCPGLNIGSRWRSIYQEGGMGLAQITSPSLVDSPAMTVWKGAGAFLPTATISSRGYFHVGNGFKCTPNNGNSESFETIFGETNYPTLWQMTGTVSWPLTARLCLDPLGSGDVGYNYAGSVLQSYFTCPTTNKHFGQAAAVPFAQYYLKLMIGDSVSDARLVTNAPSLPTPTAIGEIYYNQAPNATGAGSNTGWKSTAIGTAVPFGGRAAHQANSSAAVLADLVTDFNALLAKLQAADLMG